MVKEHVAVYSRSDKAGVVAGELYFGEQSFCPIYSSQDNKSNR